MWKNINPADMPKNWSYVPRDGDRNDLVLAKWSSSNYSWIGHNLTPIMSLRETDEYFETPYARLTDFMYRIERGINPA